MGKNSDVSFIRKNFSESELLTVIAEEASELAQAALKLRRTITPGASPTPTTEMEARANFIEEVADVKLSLALLGIVDNNQDVKYIFDTKAKRMVNRLTNQNEK